MFHEIFVDEKLAFFYGLKPFESLGQTLEQIAIYETRLANNTGIHWGVLHNGHGKVIGSLGLYNYQPKVCAEIGFGINPKYRNQGLITEAIARVVKFGFTQLHVNRIEARVDPRNGSSIKVLEKAGFIREAHLRQNVKLLEEYCDTLIYSLLKSDIASL